MINTKREIDIFIDCNQKQTDSKNINVYNNKITNYKKNKRKKELKEYKEAARSEANLVNELQAENKKLREALEYIQSNTESSYIFNWAEEALKKE